jgi:CRP/FNR family transcriptional regulator
MRSVAITATLRQCRLFSDLSSEDVNEVAGSCAIRSLARGETLFREGTPAEGFYVVRSGAISVFRVTPDGREQIICVFHPGESFAEVTLATTESYPANAVAADASQVIFVRKDAFIALVRRKPELSLRMLASMSMHLKHLVQMLQGLKGRQIEARLAEWLLAQIAPCAPEASPTIKLGVTKKILAGQLGVTSETLSRTLARLRDEHVIAVDGPRITLLDRTALEAFASGTR